MIKFKLKDGIGAVAAENDSLLIGSFIDNGYFDEISKIDSNKFILLGRTGSGKSAILEYLKNQYDEKMIREINIDELNLKYLRDNNSLYKIRNSNNGNYEAFYKLLWKHIFILEICQFIQNNYSDNWIQSIFERRDKTRARELTKEYFNKYKDSILKPTELNIESKVEECIIQDENQDSIQIKANIKPEVSVNSGVKNANSKKITQNYKNENSNNIVSSEQISSLNSVIDVLKNSFFDSNKKYFIVIDNIDTHWTNHDIRYNEILKYFLKSIKEINRTFRRLNIKIILSIRENIFNSILQINRENDQIEKWKDHYLVIEWSNENLIGLVNKRLSNFKHYYKNSSPTYSDLLPEESSFYLVLEKTFKRPRDIIQFYNYIFESFKVEEISKISEDRMQSYLRQFENHIIESVNDEWRSNFPYLEGSLRLLKGLKSNFYFNELNEDSLLELIQMGTISQNIEISSFYKENDTQTIKEKILDSWYTVGFIDLNSDFRHGNSYVIFKKIPFQNKEELIFEIHPCLFNQL